MTLAAALALATALAVAALLAAHAAERPRVAGAAKMLASSAFLAFALALGATGSGYGRAVLAALVLSWVGDLALIPKGARKAFLVGLVAFLLAHVAYLGAFALRPWSGAVALAALVPVVLAAGLAWRWLRPHVERAMRAPVAAYVTVISAMVVAAAGASGGSGDLRIAAGAFAFYLSDLAVARERFVARSRWNAAWGLPLNYGAQLLLAASVVQRASAAD